MCKVREYLENFKANSQYMYCKGDSFDITQTNMLKEHLNIKKIFRGYKDQNFTQTEIDDIKDILDNKKVDTTLENMIISQPNGSQKAPDVLLILNRKALKIEYKKIKSKGKPKFNSGLPDKQTIYLFSSVEGNTFFKGSSIISDKDRSILTSSRKEIAEQCEHILCDGWQVYHRPDYTPRHNFYGIDRDTTELAVLNYIDSLFN